MDALVKSSVALLLFIATPTACLSEQEQESQQKKRLVIQGHIQQLDHLAPVTLFRVGDKFDESNLPKAAGAIGYWFKVPNWLAGTWHHLGRVQIVSMKNLSKNQEMQHKREKYVTYENDEVVGFQKDKQGNIWTCIPVPYVSRDTIKGIMNVNIIGAAEAVESADESVSIMLTAMTVSVNVSTKKIVSIAQRQSLQIYRPISSRTIEISTSAKFFDEVGSPIYSQELLAHNRRIHGYEELGYLPMGSVVSTVLPEGVSGIDLRRSFISFLTEHDLQNLIPDYLMLLYSSRRDKILQVPLF